MIKLSLWRIRFILEYIKTISWTYWITAILYLSISVSNADPGVNPPPPLDTVSTPLGSAPPTDVPGRSPEAPCPPPVCCDELAPKWIGVCGCRGGGGGTTPVLLSLCRGGGELNPLLDPWWWWCRLIRKLDVVLPWLAAGEMAVLVRSPPPLELLCCSSVEGRRCMLLVLLEEITWVLWWWAGYGPTIPKAWSSWPWLRVRLTALK